MSEPFARPHQQERIDRLEAQVAVLAIDAARYRWLRDVVDTASRTCGGQEGGSVTKGVAEIVHIAPAPYVTINLASAITGLSEKAIRRKIEAGKWLDGHHYRRAPDGGIFISIEGYKKWVEGRP